MTDKEQPKPDLKQVMKDEITHLINVNADFETKIYELKDKQKANSTRIKELQRSMKTLFPES